MTDLFIETNQSFHIVFRAGLSVAGSSHMFNSRVFEHSHSQFLSGKQGSVPLSVFSLVCLLCQQVLGQRDETGSFRLILGLDYQIMGPLAERQNFVINHRTDD